LYFWDAVAFTHFTITDVFPATVEMALGLGIEELTVAALVTPPTASKPTTRLDIARSRIALRKSVLNNSIADVSHKTLLSG
jgi:hypothetical protein